MDEQGQSNQPAQEMQPATPPGVPPVQPGPEPKPKMSRLAVILLVILAAVVVGGALAWVILLRDNGNQNGTSSQQTSTDQNSQPKSVEIPEIGIKIADPENRGLKIFYDDSAKAKCQADENYYAGNVCENYLNSTHCQDMNLADEYPCSYYIYDNTTYDPNSNTSTNAADFAKYYKCDSDLTIYETSPENDNAEPGEWSALVKVNDTSIALWAHASRMDSCDDATADNTDAYMKNLLQYVKANVSAMN